MSGSFWTTSAIEKAIRQSDVLRETSRREKLNEIEKYASHGAAYLPIWIVKPRAWAQIHLAKPEFDRDGQLLLERLRRIK